MNVKDVSDAHKNGQTLVFENARVLPVPEKPGDKVGKVGVGIYKQDREALTYLAGAVMNSTLWMTFSLQTVQNCWMPVQAGRKQPYQRKRLYLV